MEELVAAASVLQEQQQLLEAVAEDAAIEDAFLQLDQAARRGRLDADSLMKRSSELALRQFRVRYLSRKIDAMLAQNATARAAMARGGAAGAPSPAGGAPAAGGAGARGPVASGFVPTPGGPVFPSVPPSAVAAGGGLNPFGGTR